MKKILAACLAAVALAVAFSGCGGKKVSEYDALMAAVETGDVLPMVDYVKDGMVRVKGKDENGKSRDFYIGTVNFMLSTMFAGMDIREVLESDGAYITGAEYEVFRNIPVNFCAMTYDGMVDVVNGMSTLDGKVPFYQGKDYERHPLADGYRIADLQELRLAEKKGAVNFNIRETFMSKLENLRKSGSKEIREVLSGDSIEENLVAAIPGLGGSLFDGLDEAVTFFDYDIDYSRKDPDASSKDGMEKYMFSFQALDGSGNVVDMDGYMGFLSSLMNFYVVIDAKNFK